LQDSISFTSNIIHRSGTLDANGFNVTANLYSLNDSPLLNRSLIMGTGTFSFKNNGNVWDVSATNLTFSGANATIVIDTPGASIHTFNGGGLTYGTLTYTVAGSTGALHITGSDTFNTINFSDASNARSLRFTAGTTTTVTNFNVNGTPGKLMTVESVTAATHTLTKPSGAVSCDYLNVINSIATGAAAWYAGANSRTAAAIPAGRSMPHRPDSAT
jgi:hypothetical protein